MIREIPKGLMDEWEAKLAAQGMPSEIGVDKGKEKLQQSMQESGELKAHDAEIIRALQTYWVFREGSLHGEHLKIAQEIAGQLGISADEIPQDLVDAIREEISAADKKAREIASTLVKKNPKLSHNAAALAREVEGRLYDEYPTMDRDALTEISFRGSRRLLQ